jgi:hypothetical protein
MPFYRTFRGSALCYLGYSTAGAIFKPEAARLKSGNIAEQSLRVFTDRPGLARKLSSISVHNQRKITFHYLG